jgi:uncharacterized repeat protein (TIGR03803 family)
MTMNRSNDCEHRSHARHEFVAAMAVVSALAGCGGGGGPAAPVTAAPTQSAAAACVHTAAPSTGASSSSGGTAANPTVGIVYSFTGSENGSTDGAFPNAGLLLASDGNFYGTTLGGGTNVGSVTASGAGTVFRISPAGAETVLYSFGSHTGDGTNPQASLVVGCDGALYGTTRFGGGTNGTNYGEGGTVYRIDTTGNESTLYTFGSAPTDGTVVKSPLTLATDGNLYGITVQGGANDTGTIFRADQKGNVQSVYSFAGAPGGMNPIGALLQASDGTLFGTTMAGGNNTQGTVFSFSTASLSYHDIYSFSETVLQGVPVAAYLRGGFVQGSDGALYGTDTCGGAPPGNYTFTPNCGSGVLFKITTNGALTSLYSFPALSFEIPPPETFTPTDGLVQAADGNFYGVTRAGTVPVGTDGAIVFGANGAVFRMTPAGVVTILYNFTGQPDGASPNGSLAVGPDGNLYGTTQRGGTADRGTVFKVVLSGN